MGARIPFLGVFLIILFLFMPLVHGNGLLSRGIEPLRLYENNRPSVRTEAPPCDGNEANCATDMLRMISGFHLAEIQAGGGVFADFSSNARPNVNLGMTMLHIEFPALNFDAARFMVNYLPGGEGMRFTFSLADLQAAFICVDLNGRPHIPGIGRAFQYCRPDTGLAFSLNLLRIQWDSHTQRFAGRWAVFNAVFDFFRGGHSMQRLRYYFDGMVGVNVDTVWSGNMPAAAGTLRSNGSPQSNFRAFVGIANLVRSQDARWEFRSELIFRPAVIAGASGHFDDMQAEAHAHFLRQFQAGPRALGAVGIEASASYCQNPVNCIGTYASDSQPFSMYIGALIRANAPFSF